MTHRISSQVPAWMAAAVMVAFSASSLAKDRSHGPAPGTPGNPRAPLDCRLAYGLGSGDGPKGGTTVSQAGMANKPRGGAKALAAVKGHRLVNYNYQVGDMQTMVPPHFSPIQTSTGRVQVIREATLIGKPAPGAIVSDRNYPTQAGHLGASFSGSFDDIAALGASDPVEQAAAQFGDLWTIRFITTGWSKGPRDKKAMIYTMTTDCKLPVQHD